MGTRRRQGTTRAARLRRHVRIRRRTHGTAERPRLAVFRSNQHIYSQIINDDAGHTLVAASDLEADLRQHRGSKVEQAGAVGGRLAERARAAGLTAVVFDRGGYRYHGRVKALADAARQGGLQF